MTEFFSLGHAKVRNGSTHVESADAFATWTPGVFVSGDQFETTAVGPHTIATDPVYAPSVYDITVYTYQFELGLAYGGADSDSVDYLITKTSAAWGTNREIATLLAEQVRVAGATQITETELDTAVAAAESASTSATATFQTFDKRFLGPLASDPLLDNEGAPLQNGAVYANTSISPVQLRIYDTVTSTWSEMLAGQIGPPGVGGGVQFDYQTSTTVADPGPGNMHINATDHTAATILVFDASGSDGVSFSDSITAWGSSTSSIKGTVTIWDSTNRAIYVQYRVTDVPTDHTGWLTVPVVYVAGAGTLPPGTICEVVFSEKGDKGDTGAPGVTIGIEFQWETSTTLADPGNGGILANSATFGAITIIAADNLDFFGNATTAYLDHFDDVTNAVSRGTWTLQSTLDPSVRMQFWVTGAVTDSGGYRQIVVTPISGAIPPNGTMLSSVFVSSGTDGVSGTSGTSAGVGWAFDTSTTDSAPSNGNVRASSGTLTSATWLDVSKTDRYGNDASGWLKAIGDSSNPTSKGRLVVKRLADNATLYVYPTAVADHSGYVHITIDATKSSGTAAFSAADQLNFEFYPSGDVGAGGAGGGDVSGPVSSVSGNIALWADTAGTTLSDSGVAMTGLTRNSNNLSDMANTVTAHDNLWAHGSNITPGGTIDLEGANGHVLYLAAGTVTAVTLADGHIRLTKLTGAVTLTDNTVINLNNGGSNISGVSGDWVLWIGEGSGLVSGLVLPAAGFGTGAYIPSSYLDTDGTLAANSDTKVASQKAVKTYADAGYRPGGAHIVAVADGGTGSGTTSTARTNLGLGTMAVQDAATVAITGGTAAGLTSLQVTSTDSGAGMSGYLELFRDSSSPAASDVLSGVLFYGRNGSAAKVLYGQLSARVAPLLGGVYAGELVLSAMNTSGALIDVARVTSGGLIPFTDNTVTIGSSGTGYSGGYWSSGALLNFGAGDYTLTHSTGFLTANKDLRITTAGTNTASVVTVGGTQTLTGKSLSLAQVTGLASGVATFLAGGTSAQLASVMTDETGSGALVFANTPTLVTPNIGAATGSSLVLTTSGLGSVLSLVSTDAGAVAAPNLELYRNSASPAVNDVLGGINWYGNDNLGSKLLWGSLTAKIEFSNTTASGTTRFYFNDNNAGLPLIPLFSISNVDIVGHNAQSLGNTATGWTGLYISSGGFLDFANGDVQVVHSTNTLSFTGASSGYIFDAGISVSSTGFPLTIVNTNTSSTAATVFEAIGSKSTPAVNDSLLTRFFLQNSSNASIEYIRLLHRASVVTAGAEDGQFFLQMMKSGTLTTAFQVTRAGIFPGVANGQSVGNAGTPFSDVFIGSGGTLNFSTDSIFTHITGGLRMTTGTMSWGTFSATGVTRGATINTNGTYQVSANGIGSFQHFQFYNTNGQVGNINTSASATAFATSSDETMKDFVGVYDPKHAIAVILADPVRDYRWKISGDYGVGWGAQTSYGIAAGFGLPQMDLAVPGGWHTESGEPANDNDPGAVYSQWGIDPSRRVPYIWAATSWLLETVSDHETRIAKLEAEIAELRRAA